MKSAALLWLAAALAVLFGCSHEQPWPDACPSCPGIRIEGRVEGPAGPVAARVSAYPIPDDLRRNDRVWARTDSSGRFSLVVTAGDWYLALHPAGPHYDQYYYSRAGVMASRYLADTLRITGGEEPIEADFTFGGLRILMQFPPGLDGREYDIWANTVGRRGDHWYSFQQKASARVADGRAEFDFPSLPPGPYTARADLGSEVISLPPSTDPDAGDTIRVAPRQMTGYETAIADPPARVSGSIRGAWQELGLDRPEVSIYDPDHHRLVYNLRADSSGEFAADLFLADRVRLALLFGHVTVWVGGKDITDATEFALTPGQETRIPDLLLGAFRLRLFGPGDGPSWASKVTVCDRSGAPVFQDDLYAFLSNILTVPALPAGEYTIHLEPHSSEDWAAQWYDGSPTFEGATPVVIPPGGEVVTLDVNLAPTAR